MIKWKVMVYRKIISLVKAAGVEWKYRLWQKNVSIFVQLF